MHRPYQKLALARAALASALLVVSGCAGGKDAADKQIDALRAEIARVQADQDRILERVGGLEARQERADRGEGGAPKERREAAAPGDRPPLQVVVLKPEGDGKADGEVGDAADDDAPRTTVRAEGDPARPGKKAKGQGATKADIEREYQDALSLAKKKQHQKALEAFTGFLVRYPDHAHADNALFWMGESHLGLGEDARALEQFESVLARFPDGNKAPDALLKIALIRRKQGDAEGAKEALSRLRKRYPNSDAARRAPKE